MLKAQSTIPFLTISLLLTSLACSGEGAHEDSESSEPLGSESSPLRWSPPLPSPDLAVPDGNRLAFYLDAIGVQIYECQAASTGFAWTFQAPEASLFDRHGRLVVDHYAGPTWESIADGSQVVASRIAGFTDDPSAIPELLLAATTHEGKGRMSRITYVQRLETSGGLAPVNGCDAHHVGATARVDYTATYYFYRAKPHSCD